MLRRQQDISVDFIKISPLNYNLSFTSTLHLPSSLSINLSFLRLLKMPPRKRKALEELSKNLYTTKERRRLEIRTSRQVTYENTRKADAESVRRCLKIEQQSTRYQVASITEQKRLEHAVREKVKADR
jgi:hypothetical protein